MRYAILLMATAGLIHPCSAQLTIESAQKASQPYHVSSYSYHEQFIGHPGYGAPLILTQDGGAAAFGDGDAGSMLYKFDPNGALSWKTTFPAKGKEMELQSAVQTSGGDYLVFALIHGLTSYVGGCERAAFIDKMGKMGWDKMLGSCNQVNNPTVSYIRSLADGRVALRGHVVKEPAAKGKDPVYRYWEAWITTDGKMTEKVGPAIDWSKKEEWQSRLAPESDGQPAATKDAAAAPSATHQLSAESSAADTIRPQIPTKQINDLFNRFKKK